MNIEEMQDRAHANSIAKGWWPELQESEHLPDESVASRLALIHSEVSEALECVREGQLDMTRVPEYGPGPGQMIGHCKPEGLPSELADILIRTADLAAAMGIDLQIAVCEKMAYNATRPHRHGGKRL